MSGKKVEGLARPEFKPKEKAPVQEAVPQRDDYNSPAYQDPGLCAGTVGRAIFILLLVAVVLMFLLAFGLNLGYGIKHTKPAYICLLLNIVLSTIVTGFLAFWYYKGILKTSYLWYIFLQCAFLFFQLVTTDIFAVLASTAPPTTAPPTIPTSEGPTDPITPSPTSNATTPSLMPRSSPWL